MITRRAILAGGVASLTTPFWLSKGALACNDATSPLKLSDGEWQKRLTPEQYAILRKSGTEYPFTSPLLHENRRGNFVCAGCDLDLFASTTKFESGTGWPSFWASLDKAVNETEDSSFGMVRTAVNCCRCDGHIGHVFNDGPQPTGLRYCMNGVALKFKPLQA